jgi:hypothetical protein
MTSIHILFAKILVKIFNISLKYTQLLHVLTSLGHLKVNSFSRNLVVTRTLKYAVVYLFLVLHGVPSTYVFIAAALCTLDVLPLGRERAVLVLCSHHSDNIWPIWKYVRIENTGILKDCGEMFYKFS